MAKQKWSLAELATHLELMAEGQNIIARFLSESNLILNDKDYSREKTLQAARVLRGLAPFQKEIRTFLIKLRSAHDESPPRPLDERRADNPSRRVGSRNDS